MKYFCVILHIMKQGVMNMPCRFTELKKKEVINFANGCKLGYVDDLEMDTKCAKIIALIAYGRPRLFGLFGHAEECYIPWEKIRLIGEDAILVENSVQKMAKKAKNRHKFVTICHHLFL